jgi:hypothetical protein
MGEEASEEPRELLLDGFVYDKIQPCDRKRWLRWLGRAIFASQPYEQLAEVYRRLGQREDAVEILVAKEKARLRHGRQRWYRNLWSRLLGLLVGFGHKPGRALVALVVVGLLGTLIFWTADAIGAMAQQNKECGNFNSFVYSFDTLIPVIDLHVESCYEPKMPDGSMSRGAYLVWCYLRVHILLGWFLTTVGLFAVTGIVRKE